MDSLQALHMVQAFVVEHREDFAALAHEEELLAGAVRHAGAQQLAQAKLLATVGAFYFYLFRGGHWRLGVELYGLALAATRTAGDRAGEGTTLNNLGLLANSLGDPETARHYYEQALAIFRAIGLADRAQLTQANLNNLLTILAAEHDNMPAKGAAQRKPRWWPFGR